MDRALDSRQKADRFGLPIRFSASESASYVRFVFRSAGSGSFCCRIVVLLL